MQVHIAKVNGVLYSGEARALVVPAKEGEMTILKDHVPVVTTLRPGRITVQKDGRNETFDVEKGILEVTADGATVLL